MSEPTFADLVNDIRASAPAERNEGPPWVGVDLAANPVTPGLVQVVDAGKDHLALSSHLMTIEARDVDGAYPKDMAMLHGSTPIVRYDRTAAALNALRVIYQDVTFDLTTTAGDKAARAARLELVTLRTSLEKRRVEFKSPAIAFGKLVDSEAARITAEIEALEKPIDSQIKADEARRAAEKRVAAELEAARVAKLEAGLAVIRSYTGKAGGLPAARIELGIEALKKMTFLEAAWGDYTARAEETRREVLEALVAMHAQTLGREQEARRQEEIRQENARQAEINAAESKRIAEEAAALRTEAAASTARLDAERAEFVRMRDAARAAEEVAARQKALEAAAAIPAPTPQPDAAPAATAPPAPPPPPPEQPAKATAPIEPTISISVINARVGDGFGMTAAFIQNVVGVPGTKVGKSVLYTEQQWDSIKRRLAIHLGSLA